MESIKNEFIQNLVTFNREHERAQFEFRMKLEEFAQNQKNEMTRLAQLSVEFANDHTKLITGMETLRKCDKQLAKLKLKIEILLGKGVRG